MRLENRLNSLIRAGRHVIDSDFDVQAFREWKREAWECVTALTAPDNSDTVNVNMPGAHYDREKPDV